MSIELEEMYMEQHLLQCDPVFWNNAVEPTNVYDASKWRNIFARLEELAMSIERLEDEEE